MSQSKERLVKRILELSDGIFNAMPVNIPAEWLSSDLTLAQLRVLLVLYAQGPMRMSDIAAAVEIALPTATGIVDNLVKKEFVLRENHPKDRRQVICRLSVEGQQLVRKLWVSGQTQIAYLLDGLTIEEMEKSAEVARILYDNISKKAGKSEGQGVA